MFVRAGFSIAAIGVLAASAVAATNLTQSTRQPPADLVVSDASLTGGGLGLRPQIAQADTGIATIPAPVQTDASPAGSPAATSVTDTTSAPADTGDGSSHVDESALRYFAQQGDINRVEAEIRRLKMLHPDWQPPVDLFDPGSAKARGVDLQPIWNLYGAGRYGEARQAIAQLQQARPNWKPPADLMTALNQAEARQRLVNASENKQWDQVLDIASQNQALLVCANVDILWRVAQAYLKTGKADRTRDVYAYILKNCSDPKERAATMQKAAADLPSSDANSLMSYAREEEGKGEFKGARLALVRAQIGLANRDPSVTVAPDDLAAIASAANEAKTGDDAVLLGFYYYSHKEPDQAATWFKTALDRNGGAKAAEGYVLSMKAAGNDLAAVPVAYQWRDSNTTNKAAYLSLVGGIISAPSTPGVDQAMVSQYAAVVTKTKSAYGALSLGWYALNHAQQAAAAEWFQSSLDYEASEAAAYGLGLAMLALKNTAGFAAVQTQWVPRYPQLAALFRSAGGGAITTSGPQALGAQAAPVAAVGSAGLVVPAAANAVSPAPISAVATSAAPTVAKATSAARTGGGASAPAGCATDIDVANLSPAAAVARGWCLMNRNRPMEAAEAFNSALSRSQPQSRTASDAAYGKSLAYLRAGLTDSAAVAAAAAPLTTDRKVDLATQLLTQRALAAYASGRYAETIALLDQRSQVAPETRDLMLMRGWSYYNLNDFLTAIRVFTAVDTATSTPQSQQALATVREAMLPPSMQNFDSEQ